MIIEAVIKISLIGFASVLLGTVLFESKKEYSVLLKISAVAAVFLIAIKTGADKLKEFIFQANRLEGQSEVLTVLFKGAVICILTGVICDLCRENGNHALSGAIETAARIIIIILALPLIDAVMETAFSFMK